MGPFHNKLKCYTDSTKMQSFGNHFACTAALFKFLTKTDIMSNSLISVFIRLMLIAACHYDFADHHIIITPYILCNQLDCLIPTPNCAVPMVIVVVMMGKVVRRILF